MFRINAMNRFSDDESEYDPDMESEVSLYHNRFFSVTRSLKFKAMLYFFSLRVLIDMIYASCEAS